MKRKRILAMILAVASCLSLAVSASAANTTVRKATDFRDYDRTAWYAEAVSAAVDNGLLYGKSATIIDPNGDISTPSFSICCATRQMMYTAASCPFMYGVSSTSAPTSGRFPIWKSWWRPSAAVKSLPALFCRREAS